MQPKIRDGKEGLTVSASGNLSEIRWSKAPERIHTHCHGCPKQASDLPLQTGKLSDKYGASKLANWSL